MNAPTGLNIVTMRVTAALITFSTRNSLIGPSTASLRSPSFSWIHFQRPAGPSVTSVLKTSTTCSMRETAGSPISFTTLPRMRA